MRPWMQRCLNWTDVLPRPMTVRHDGTIGGSCATIFFGLVIGALSGYFLYLYATESTVISQPYVSLGERGVAEMRCVALAGCNTSAIFRNSPACADLDGVNATYAYNDTMLIPVCSDGIPSNGVVVWAYMDAFAAYAVTRKTWLAELKVFGQEIPLPSVISLPTTITIVGIQRRADLEALVTPSTFSFEFKKQTPRTLQQLWITDGASYNEAYTCNDASDPLFASDCFGYRVQASLYFFRNLRIPRNDLRSSVFAPLSAAAAIMLFLSNCVRKLPVRSDNTGSFRHTKFAAVDVEPSNVQLEAFTTT